MNRYNRLLSLLVHNHKLLFMIILVRTKRILEAFHHWIIHEQIFVSALEPLQLTSYRYCGPIVVFHEHK